MFRTHLLPLCCFTVSFITRINSYTIGIMGTTSVSTNLRTWYSGSYILRFFYLECWHKVTKKSILHIYKLIGTYLILFGISFTHLSHKQLFIYFFQIAFTKFYIFYTSNLWFFIQFYFKYSIILLFTIMLEIFINLLMLLLK